MSESARPASDTASRPGAVRRFLAPRAERLDRLVAREVPELSRAQARRLVEEGAVTVSGVVRRLPAYGTQESDAIEVALPVLQDPLERDADRLAEDVQLAVLYEDEETLVIDKPAGLVVHPRDGVMGVTLVNVVRARYPEVRRIGDGNRPGVVHRLDRDTSGVMAYAKSLAAQEALKAQWKARETLKLYAAIVGGAIDPPAGIIDAQIGPDPADPSRRAVVEDGASAMTEYHVQERFGLEASLLSVRIRTGRTHQIRVHLAAVGHPVLGDHLYGSESPLIERQALHASRLGFTLPSTGEWREFDAPLPEDMQQLIDGMRRRHGITDGAAR